MQKRNCRGKILLPLTVIGSKPSRSILMFLAILWVVVIGVVHLVMFSFTVCGRDLFRLCFYVARHSCCELQYHLHCRRLIHCYVFLSFYLDIQKRFGEETRHVKHQWQYQRTATTAQSHSNSLQTNAQHVRHADSI